MVLGTADFELEQQHLAHPGSFEQRESVGPLDLLLVLAAHKRALLIAPLIGTIFGFVYGFLYLKPIFTSEAVILPPRMEQGSLFSMGPLAAFAGTSGQTAADTYIGMLEGRTVSDNIIHQFHLERVSHSKNIEDAGEDLTKHVKFDFRRDNLLHILVSEHEPKLASDIANAYVDQLYRLNSEFAVNEASQRRGFYDQQLDQEKVALAKAESDLRDMQERTGVIQIAGQTDVTLRNAANLQAEIASREVQLQSLRSYATDQNPDVVRLQREIGELHSQLAQAEANQSKTRAGPEVLLPAGKVPEATLEYARRLREVRFHETLLELLTKQAEAARLDQAKSAPVIQVVDHAIPALKRSGPPRKLILIVCAALGLFAAIAYAFLIEAYNNLQRSSEQAAKLARLRRLAWR